MADVRARLIECFLSVFPSLAQDAVVTASVEATEAWDSLANFSLVTVIEEEFDLQIPSDDLEQLTSFASVEAYLATR